MEQNNSYSVISIVDLFAYCVKKFWVLLFGALIGLVLLLSYHIYDSNTEKKVESYNKEVARYNEKLQAEEQSLRILNDDFQFVVKVYAQNPLFGSGDVYSAVVLFSVDSKKEVKITENGMIVSEIGQRIEKIWDTLDLSLIVGSNVESDVLKTSISFSSNGLMFMIQAYSDSKEVADAYATRVFDYFSSILEEDDENSISFMNASVSKVSKEEINNQIKGIVSRRASIMSQIVKIEDEIKSSKRNSPSKYHFFRFSALGVIAGGLVSLLCVAIGFVSKNPITSSFSMEKNLSMQFLGSMFVDNGVLTKISRRIIGERKFKNDREAEEFIKNTISSKYFCSDDKVRKITVVSSQDQKFIKDAGERISKILNDCGYNAEVLTCSANNPDLANTIENSDAIVLLERQWITKTQLVKSTLTYMNSCGKSVLGFFLC